MSYFDILAARAGAGGDAPTPPPVLIEKSVAANGTYSAQDDEADGYSAVTVNVPNSYAAGDEGKVVSNGALVAQTGTTATTNGTINTTTNNSVTVAVPTYSSADNGKVIQSGALTAQGTHKPITANGTGIDTTYYSSVDVAVPIITTNKRKWVAKIWSGLTSFNGDSIWTDGTNIYCSANSTSYVLDRSTSTWSVKTWSGITNPYASYVWSDGTNIYYSHVSSNQYKHYVLNKSTSTWSTKAWNGTSMFVGSNVWSDGSDIYISNSSSVNYILNKSTSTWSTKTWNGTTPSNARVICTDGVNIYYIIGGNSHPYVLDKATSTWSELPFTTGYSGSDAWTDGLDVVFSSSQTSNYIVDRNTKTFIRMTDFTLPSSGNGSYIWSDGENVYYSKGESQYVLEWEYPKLQNASCITCRTK